MKRRIVFSGILVSSLFAACGQEQDHESALSGNSSSAVLAETVGCQQGVVAPRGNGNLVEVSGTWSGSRALSSLTVKGQAATLNGNQWVALVPASIGLNLFDVEAKDSGGRTVLSTCAVYAAHAVTAPKTLFENSVLLALRKGAIDDGAANAEPMESLADALRIAAQSGGIRELIDEKLSAQPNLGESANRKFVYESLSFGTPEVKLTLIDGGLDLKLRIPSIRVKGTIKRTRGLIRPDHEATMKISFVEINPTFLIDLDANKQLKVSVKKPVKDPAFGSFDSDVDGGLLAEIIEEIVNGRDSRIKGSIGDALKDGIETELNQALKGYLQSLAIGPLPSARIEIPKMDRSGNTTIQVVSKLSQVDFQAEKAVIAAATRVDGTTAATESEWLPATSPALPSFFTDNAATESGAAISSTLFNQVLYRLWKNGNFEMASVPNLNSRISSAKVKFSRPPMVSLNAAATAFNLGVGPITMTMTVAGVEVPVHIFASFDVPFTLSAKGEFNFGTVTNTDSTIQLPAGFSWAQSTLEAVFIPLATAHFNRLFSELNPVSIPSFKIPASLVPFGFMPNVKIGLVDTKLAKNAQYLIVKGALGETFRPTPPRPEPQTCTEGTQRRGSCRAGYTGHVIQECRDNVWHDLQNLCVKNSSGGDTPFDP